MIVSSFSYDYSSAEPGPCIDVGALGRDAGRSTGVASRNGREPAKSADNYSANSNNNNEENQRIGRSDSSSTSSDSASASGTSRSTHNEERKENEDERKPKRPNQLQLPCIARPHNKAANSGHITMATEDLLQPGHVVKERWKVVRDPFEISDETREKRGTGCGELDPVCQSILANVRSALVFIGTLLEGNEVSRASCDR